MTTALARRGPAPALDPNLSLDELAGIANAEHQLAVTAAASAVEHGIRCGEVLTEIRSRFPVADGSWPSWVAGNLSFTIGTAQTFVRWAAYAQVLRANGAESYDDAIRLLRGLPPAFPSNYAQVVGDLREEARGRRAEGESYQQIATAMGRSIGTVYQWLNPDAKRKYRARARAARLRRQEAVREKAIKRAVKKAGAALAEAWNRAEQQRKVLDQAHAEAERGSDQAREIEAAVADNHRQIDHLVKALGIE